MTKFVIRDTSNGNTNTYDTREKAESQKDELEELGAEVELEVVDDGAGENGDSPSDTDASSNGEAESDTTHAEMVEPDTRQSEAETSNGVVEASPVKETQNLPKISPVEDTARQVISQLNSDDMNRLVWDPNANNSDVPYNVQGLPYDKPEPSAEAFDLFAGIIEGAMNVQYSVEDVDFEETENTFECNVVIEKRGENGTKRLVGIKTRDKSNTTGTDHWRERLYSKARRNALKQDIPPTMVSSLLARYREVTP